MPPTLEEILNAIQTATSARAAELDAEQSYGVINAAVSQATGTEEATFAAHQATYDAALATARNAAGWPAALEALQVAVSARVSAEASVLVMMRTYVENTPV
jgi:hypothetical protein